MATSRMAQTPPMLSLAQAVNEALVKNERIVNQSDAIAQADLGLRLARNTFRPKVTPNIFGSLGRDDISSQTYRVDVSQKLVTGTELRVSTGTVSRRFPATPATRGDVLFYNADTTLTVSQPLLRGFGRSVARRGLTSAEMRREEARSPAVALRAAGRRRCRRGLLPRRVAAGVCRCRAAEPDPRAPAARCV